LQHLIEDRVRSSPNLEMLSLRLNTVYDEIRRNHTPAARSINRSLDQTPGGRQRYLRAMHDIGQLFDTIEMPLTDVSGMRRHWAVATIGQMLSTIMTTTAGREAFREAVIDGRGVLSLNAVALAANMGRRELGLTPFTPPDDAAGAGTGP
jgi:hypothetical protein